MPITKQDKHELDQMHSDWSDQYGGCKQDYFACLYLTKKLRCGVPEIAPRISFGSHDYGLDAYFIDREAKNLYLYQFKWTEDHNLFRESLDKLAKDGMQFIFGNPLADSQASPFLNNLRAELKEYKSVIKHVLIHFVFKGDGEAADKSEGLAGRKENLENKIHLVHQYFGDPEVELSVEFFADRRPPPKPKPAEAHKIGFSQNVCVKTHDQKQVMYVGFLPLMDLYRIYKCLDQRFLDRNIRFGLSADNAPNKKIREAFADIVIKKKVSPDIFAFNHNGITLAAEQITFHDGHALVNVPRLLNGAQTITSVKRFLEDYDDHPALKDKDSLQALEAIKVLAKIVVDDPFSDFVTNVTICNNRQNPVQPWTLRANDRIQCDLYDKLREDVNVFYSRQENAFENFSYEELEEMGVGTEAPIRIRPLARTFLAVQGEISKMSKLPFVFEDKKCYEETFRESYLQCDARKIVLAYNVQLVLNSPMQRLEERTSQKLGLVIFRAKDLVWALLIQGLLNDDKLPELLEEYGTKVKRVTAFREHLKTLASTKVLQILKEVLGYSEFKERIEKERYDFVRTKEIFSQCKTVAADKFGWIKKSL